MTRFDGEVALVTDGACGIGRARSSAWSPTARVAFCDIDIDIDTAVGRQTASETGDQNRVHACDLADEIQITDVVARVALGRMAAASEWSGRSPSTPRTTPRILPTPRWWSTAASRLGGPGKQQRRTR